MIKMIFYAVRVGRIPGIYSRWEDVAPQVLNIPYAMWQAYWDLSAAEAFLKANGGPVSVGFTAMPYQG